MKTQIHLSKHQLPGEGDPELQANSGCLRADDAQFTIIRCLHDTRSQPDLLKLSLNRKSEMP